MIKSHLLYQLSYRGEGETISKNRFPGNPLWPHSLSTSLNLNPNLNRNASSYLPLPATQLSFTFTFTFTTHSYYFSSSTRINAMTVSAR